MFFHEFSMIFHGCPWFSMVVHGFPWFSMVFHGFPWFSMNVFDINYYAFGRIGYVVVETLGFV